MTQLIIETCWTYSCYNYTPHLASFGCRHRHQRIIIIKASRFTKFRLIWFIWCSQQINDWY